MGKKITAVKKMRILAIGAHPDDCEFKCGGTAALWAAAGHTVCFVSSTNGGTGHHAIGGIELVRRRQAEFAAAAKTLGVTERILDTTNGELEPTLLYRRVFIKLIREFAPDLILTHRPNDYHPDHRYTSQLVLDSSYVITVPNNLPTVPALRASPVIAYFSDDFKKPVPFQPDAVVAIDAVFARKIKALDCHRSQVYEWIPWNQRVEKQVPKEPAQRRAWLAARFLKYDYDCADRFRARLCELYGQQAGGAVKTAEAFEFCEYGGRLAPEKFQELFPLRACKK